MRILIGLLLIGLLGVAWWLIFRVALRNPNLTNGADTPGGPQNLGGGGHG